MVANKNIEKFDFKHFEKFLIFTNITNSKYLDFKKYKSNPEAAKIPNYFPNYGNINPTF